MNRDDGWREADRQRFGRVRKEFRAGFRAGWDMRDNMVECGNLAEENAMLLCDIDDLKRSLRSYKAENTKLRNRLAEARVAEAALS